MTIRAHIPDLDSIAVLQPADIRMFALVGVVVSLSAEIEFLLFEFTRRAMYQAGTFANSLFDNVGNNPARLRLVDTLLQWRLAQEPAVRDQWNALRDRIKQLQSQSGVARNLFAHAPVSLARVRRPYHGPALPNEVIITPEQGQHESRMVVGIPTVTNQLRKNPPSTADIDVALALARELAAVVRDLQAFYYAHMIMLRR